MFIPWDEFEIAYSNSMTDSRLSPPTMSVHIELDALINKEKLGASDKETVEQIRENPYLKDFIGLKEVLR